MYRCERCGGVFGSFTTPGQCPLCGVWASVRCTGCGYTGHANEFVKNNDRCPKCGARVSVPGGSDAEGVLGCAALVILVLIGCAVYRFFAG